MLKHRDYHYEIRNVKSKLNSIHDNLRDRDFLLSNGTLYQKEVTERKITDMKVMRELIRDLKIYNRKIEMQEEGSAAAIS